MNDDAPLSPTLTNTVPRGTMHDDSPRLYENPAAMDEYHTVLAASAHLDASLRCDHEVSLYEPCVDCAAEVAP